MCFHACRLRNGRIRRLFCFSAPDSTHRNNHRAFGKCSHVCKSRKVKQPRHGSVHSCLKGQESVQGCAQVTEYSAPGVFESVYFFTRLPYKSTRLQEGDNPNSTGQKSAGRIPEVQYHCILRYWLISVSLFTSKHVLQSHKPPDHYRCIDKMKLRDAQKHHNILILADMAPDQYVDVD